MHLCGKVKWCATTSIPQIFPSALMSQQSLDSLQATFLSCHVQSGLAVIADPVWVGPSAQQQVNPHFNIPVLRWCIDILIQLSMAFAYGIETFQVT